MKVLTQDFRVTIKVSYIPGQAASRTPDPDNPAFGVPPEFGEIQDVSVDVDGPSRMIEGLIHEFLTYDSSVFEELERLCSEGD